MSGKFLRAKTEDLPRHPSATPPLLRFVHTHGVSVDLWSGDRPRVEEVLSGSQLDWPVRPRGVFAQVDDGFRPPTRVKGYRALVRPDTATVMSVVTGAYSVAENAWVAEAADALSRHGGLGGGLVGAAAFGRTQERTIFVARVRADAHTAVCLLVYNTHGGEGAVRFQIVEVDRATGTVYALDHQHATRSVPHVGDMSDRLRRVSSAPVMGTFVERYLSDTTPLWGDLAERLWTPRHTRDLVRELWGETPNLNPRLPDGSRMEPGEEAFRHPGHHLPHAMAQVTDAAEAFRRVCDFLDHESEACERGDFTKDRDERLTLGAGVRLKQQAWRWIVANS